MEATPVGRYTASFGLSLAVANLLSALLVVAKETNKETVLAWMAGATGHHWISHGLLTLVLFIGLGSGLAATRDGQGVGIGPGGLIGAIVGSTVLGSLIIAGFFLAAG